MDILHIQEAILHRQHHSVFLKPPSPAQVRRHNVPTQQAKHLPPTWRIRRRTGYHPRHHAERWIPHKHTHTHTHTDTPPPPTPGQPTAATPSQEPGNITHKWAPFTHFGRETTLITNIFKKADIRIAMRANNTLQKLLTPKPQTRDKYSRSGAYKLTCPDCNKAYIGQTGHSFTQRFKEHKNAFRSNRNYLQLRQTCLRTLTPIRLHPGYYADLAIPKQGCPPQYRRKILHLQIILYKQPPQ